MKKKYIYITIIGFIVIIFLYRGNKKCLKTLKNKIVNVKEDVVLDLSNDSIFCFEWRKLLFVPRDFSSADLFVSHKIKLNSFKLMGIKSIYSSDIYTYLVFLDKNNQMVASIELTENIYIDDFLTELETDYLVVDKKDAIFKTNFNGEYYVNGNKIISLEFANDTIMRNKYLKSSWFRKMNK